jgi:hypothetical protein
MLRIFIATHAPGLLPEHAADFGVIGLGGFRPSTTLPVVTDDTGDSIASKNKHYSELTGHYWLWKNAPSSLTVIGVCQYRRYFLFDPRVPTAKVYLPQTATSLAQITGPECGTFVWSALDTADVIVPRRQDLGRSICAQYVDCHRRADWDLFLQAIDETCPDLRTSVAWFNRSTCAHLYNMLVAPRSFFDAYLARLFAVTDWMERQRPFPAEPYQCRVPAFVAERFFSFYLHATRATCREVPVAILDPRAF